MPLLTLRSSVKVGRICRLAALAVSADTMDWEAPVSGMQFTSSPLVHASGGPSQSGISGVGWLEGVYNAPARVEDETVEDAEEGRGQAEAVP